MGLLPAIKRKYTRLYQAAERRAIFSALRKTRWHVKRAAALLGITYRKLRYVMDKRGIKR